MDRTVLFFSWRLYMLYYQTEQKWFPKGMCIQPMEGKRIWSLIVHHINNGMRELTESQLYHMIITIDDNIHSGGVSLHPTKKRIVYNFRSTFFAGMREITYKWYVSKEKKMIDSVPFTLSMMIWKLEKLIIRKKCIIAKLVTYSSGCIFPKRQQENWDFIHFPAFHKPGVWLL